MGVQPILQELRDRSNPPPVAMVSAESDPFRVGDSVRVHVRIVEGQRERVQAFEGVVIRRRRGAYGGTFTVRKVSYGVGVERTFPFHSPRIERVDVTAQGRVRRSRLYYLRERTGKAARIRSRVQHLRKNQPARGEKK